MSYRPRSTESKIYLSIVVAIFVLLVYLYYTKDDRNNYDRNKIAQKIADQVLAARTRKRAVPVYDCWMITGNGLKDTSYMQGTVHATCANRLNIPASVRTALLRSQSFYTEVRASKTMLFNRPLLLLPKDQPLPQLLGNTYYQKVRELLGSYQPDSILRRVHPFSVREALLSSTIMTCRITSYDFELWKIADSARLQTGALETDEEHARPVKAIPMNEMVSNLKKVIDHIHESPKELRLSISDDLKRIHDKYQRPFLDDRNKNWVPVIENAIKHQRCFFAFGNAHLPGPDGMVELLKAKGYTVTRVYNTL